jgi:hypothetical protein
MMKCAMNYAEEKPRGWEDKQWGRRGKKKTSPDRDPWYVPVGDGQDYLACRKNCRCAAAKTACACEYYHGIPMDPGYTPYGVDKPNTESDFDKTCISFGCPHPNDECFCASNTLWCCSIIKDACSPYERDFLPGAKTVWSEYDEPDPWPEHDRPTTNSKMTYEEVCACTAIPHCTDACGDSGYERGSRKDIDHLYSRWWCPNDVGNWGHGNEYPAG